MLPKIRCRFLDRITGKPVPGVSASLALGVGNANASMRIPIGTLCSDATGYLSFDVKQFDPGGSAAVGYFISVPQYGLVDHDLLSTIVSSPTQRLGNTDLTIGAAVASLLDRRKDLPCVVFPLYLDERLDGDDSEEAGCGPALLPAVQRPDTCDYKASPFSFVAPAITRSNSDCCEVLTPSALPVQQYKFSRVVVRRPDGTSAGTEARNVDVTEPIVAPTPAIKFGEVLDYEQDWFSLGHSLGEIKYSLPLAPGETTQLAVIEWKREDVASRTDSIRATEFLDHDLRRDRVIADTVDSALSEEQGGNSWSFGTTGIASGSTYGTGMWTGNHAVGGSISYSYGNRDLAAEALQDLHDRVRQATASVRSLTSTVIVQATQSESNSLQTRRVANHNHCHALTIQYYEVVRQYRLLTKFVGRRQAVLIPFAPFVFDWHAALRFRTVLEQVLLDRSLVRCFEALVRRNVVPKVYDEPEKPSVPVTPTPAKMVQKEVKVTGTSEAGVRSEVVVRTGDKITMSASGLLAFGGDTNTGARGPEGNVGFTAGRDFLAEGLVQASLLYKIGMNSPWRQGQRSALEIVADRDGEIIFGVNDMKGFFANNTAPGQEYWTVQLEYPSHEVEAPKPADPADVEKLGAYDKVADELAQVRLLWHLQANQGFYNGAVWMLMDPIERRLYLERALFDRLDVLHGLDDRPLAISGNHVAFGFRGPIAATPPAAEDPPLEDIVTLPTRGLFAEAQLGHCNACERRDMMRMWDWNEMTVEEPPEIGGITPGPKGSAPSIAQGQLPGNVVQITQPQAAPDPTALAAALGVLKTPDIFRDMAGLEEVSKMLGEMANAADVNTQALAHRAQQLIEEMKAEKQKTAGVSGGSGAEPSGVSAADAANRFSLVPEAKNLAEELGLTDEEKKDFTLGLVQGEKPKPAVKAAPMPTFVRVFAQGRVRRDATITTAPLAGLLKLSLGRMLSTGQLVSTEVVVDMKRGSGVGGAQLLRNERYVLDGTITLSPEGIANQLDQALQAISFEVTGVDLRALKAKVKSLFFDAPMLPCTGSELVVPGGGKPVRLRVLANLITFPGFTQKLTLDSSSSFHQGVNGEAKFDTTQLGKLAETFVGWFKDPEAKAVAEGVAGLLTMFSLKLEGTGGVTSSTDIKYGATLTFTPQLLEAVSIEQVLDN